MNNSLNSFNQLFKRLQTVVIGMIHVRALPGTPLNKHTMCEIIDLACKEMELYRQTRVDGVLVENMHDLPYIQSSEMGPEIVANMTRICTEVKKVAGNIPCGLQILAGGNKEALAVAAATDFQFIRAEGFVFSHIADEGPIHACAGALLRYRKEINADNVLIFTDIKKKHSSHAITADVDLPNTALAAKFFLSDGLILSGKSTGCPTNVDDLQCVGAAIRDIPILIGSGVTYSNVHQYALANGLIVGSHFKKGGRWYETIDKEKVSQFIEVVEELRIKLMLP